MAITVVAFTCHRQSIPHSSGSVATTLTSVARASLDVAQTRTASTPREATSARARGALLEMPLMAVPRYRACVQMVRSVIEMRCVSMLAATDIGEETISAVVLIK